MLTGLPCDRRHANGTRRAAWSAQLGFQNKPYFRVGLHSLVATGGTVPGVMVDVLHVYPALFMEKVGERRVLRNGKAEEVAGRRLEARFDTDEDATAAAPAGEPREVSPLIQARVRDVGCGSRRKAVEAQLTLWRPSEDCELEEGARLEVTALTVSAGPDGVPRLGTTRQTSMRVVFKHSVPPAQTAFAMALLDTTGTGSSRTEVDAIGFLVAVSPAVVRAGRFGSETTRTLFLAGPAVNAFALEVTENDEQVHLPPVLELGSLVAVRCARYRGFDAKFRLHSALATKESVVTFSARAGRIDAEQTRVAAWAGCETAQAHMEAVRMCVEGVIRGEPTAPGPVGLTTVPGRLSLDLPPASFSGPVQPSAPVCLCGQCAVSEEEQAPWHALTCCLRGGELGVVGTLACCDGGSLRVRITGACLLGLISWMENDPVEVTARAHPARQVPHAALLRAAVPREDRAAAAAGRVRRRARGRRRHRLPIVLAAHARRPGVVCQCARRAQFGSQTGRRGQVDAAGVRGAGPVAGRIGRAARVLRAPLRGHVERLRPAGGLLQLERPGSLRSRPAIAQFRVTWRDGEGCARVLEAVVLPHGLHR